MSRWSCAPWPGPGASLVINLVINLVISLVISLQWSAPPADSPCSPRYYTGYSSIVYLGGGPELRVIELLARVLGVEGGDVGAGVGVHGAVCQGGALLSLVTHAG